GERASRNPALNCACLFRVPPSDFRASLMHSSDFEYALPPALIAQHPLPDRAASRLLVLERSNGVIRHARFRDIVELVAPEDVLILNVSRARPPSLPRP